MSAAWSPLEIELPVTLEGSVVRLEPFRPDHAAEFWNVAKDDLDDIFRWMPYAMGTREDFDNLAAKASRGTGTRRIRSVCHRGEIVRPRHRQHAFHEHRSRESQSRNRFHLDRSALAAHRRQYRSKVSDAASRLRSLGTAFALN